MAEFEPAIAKTLKHEGGFYRNPEPPQGTGEVVNMGITHWTLRRLGLMPGVPKDTPRDVPASEAEVQVIVTLDPAIVKAIYQTHYWDAIHVACLRYQELADKVFDVHVNTYHGPVLLQRAYNSLNWPGGPVLVEDGVLGLKSLEAMNAVDGRILLGVCSMDSSGGEGSGFRGEAEKHYNRIGGTVLHAWIERLRKP